MDEQRDRQENESRKATRKKRPTVAELEERLERLERRLDILIARLPNPVGTRVLGEDGDREEYLDEGVAEETVRVRDVDIP